MANVRKTIGKVPVWISQYEPGTVYQKFNIVGMYDSSYISLIDNNTSAPATLSDDGKIVVDTVRWAVMVDGSAVYQFADEVKGIQSNVLAVELDAVTGRLNAVTGGEYSAFQNAEILDNGMISLTFDY